MMNETCEGCGDNFNEDDLEDGLCLDCLADMEDDEPDDDDLTTTDYRVFFRVADRKVAFAVAEGEDWKKAARDYMELDQFWPNVWFISDHGNLVILSTEEAEGDGA